MGKGEKQFLGFSAAREVLAGLWQLPSTSLSSSLTGQGYAHLGVGRGTSNELQTPWTTLPATTHCTT